MKKIKGFLLVGISLVLIGCGLLAIPSIRERVLWQLDLLQVRIRYALFPPPQQLFVPQAEVQQVVDATLTAMAPTATFTPTATMTPTHPPDKPTPTPTLTPTPTQTPTPLPASASLKGVRYTDQHGAWNYCAPANLAMALSYWGWKGTREDTGKYLKPFPEDKNVMPYEMVNFIEEKTPYGVMLRSGGTPQLLKALISSGFPVLVERGIFLPEYTGVISWMGHYQVLTGYDDAKSIFIAQDSFNGPDFPAAYTEFMQGWRAFNYVFLVVYTKDKEAQVQNLLGPLVDENRAYQIAANIASTEIVTMTGIDQFFAWYNRGTNLVKLQDYGGGAKAYDEALLKLYPNLPKDKLPFRMLWYQTGPYYAYYFVGRYYDVVNLATETVVVAEKRTGKPPYLEESFYWRAKGLLALGDTVKAGEDLKTCLKYHPGFGPCVDEAQKMGLKY
ncbi:MAG TPA: C39 family peptidase [Anaerolineaceae bacterium]